MTTNSFPTVLVLGGEGMLGHKIFQRLSAQYPSTKCTIYGAQTDPSYTMIPIFQSEAVIDRFDAMNLPSLENNLAMIRPDWVVNCIGIIKQRDDATSPIPCITLNSLLPHKLANIVGAWGGKVVHFSTDCVFSGKRGGYSEDDASDAEDLYGRSKYLGEVTTDNALTLRTSIIGRELSQFRSLLEWFLAQRGKSIRGFKRVLYSGVTTNYMAEVVGRIISDHPSLKGLYQVTSSTVSKYDLLCMLRDGYGIDVAIEPDDREFSDRSMIGDKFRSVTGFEIPSWSKLIAQLVEDPTPYDAWRK